MNKEQISNLLHYDALSDAETVTKKSYKEDESTIGIGFALMRANAQAKMAVMEATDDTFFTNELPRYTRIVESLGFRKVLELPFKGKRDDDVEETFFVYWHDDGMMLHFDTYHGNSVNSGDVRFELCSPNMAGRVSFHGSSCPIDKDTFFGWIDCREGLRFRIQDLRDRGTLVVPWTKPDVWLFHHGDEWPKDYNESKAFTQRTNRERMAMLPGDVRKAINFHE